MFNAILVHYQELALKGRNRPWFIDRLLRNLREATRGLGVAEVRAHMGRIEIVLADGADLETIRRRVSRLCGIANFALAERVPADVAAIEAAAIRQTEGLAATTFRVAAARADKQHPIPSPELERLAGSRLQEVRLAFLLHQQAAGQDFPAAQRQLGAVYEAGRGAPADLMEAYRWYYTAAVSGDPEALRALAALAQRMPPGQIGEAGSRVRLPSSPPEADSSAAVPLGLGAHSPRRAAIRLK